MKTVSQPPVSGIPARHSIARCHKAGLTIVVTVG